MKKYFFLLLLAISSNLKSEIWIDLGLKGGYSPGVIFNPYIFSNNTQILKYNHGYLFGAKAGLNFGLQHSLCVDVQYVSTPQTLQNTIDNSERHLTLKTIDVPIMYRSNQENGGYGEIGPHFSFVQSSEHSVMGDVKNRYNRTNFGLGVGFGQYIAGGDLFGLNLGFRIAYTFSDLISPTFKDHTHNPVYQPVTSEEGVMDYKGNSRIYAGVILEFNFNLGYFTQGSRCAKRTRFKMF